MPCHERIMSAPIGGRKRVRERRGGSERVRERESKTERARERDCERVSTREKKEKVFVWGRGEGGGGAARDSESGRERNRKRASERDRKRDREWEKKREREQKKQTESKQARQRDYTRQRQRVLTNTWRNERAQEREKGRERRRWYEAYTAIHDYMHVYLLLCVTQSGTRKRECNMQREFNILWTQKRECNTLVEALHIGLFPQMNHSTEGSFAIFARDAYKFARGAHKMAPHQVTSKHWSTRQIRRSSFMSWIRHIAHNFFTGYKEYVTTRKIPPRIFAKSHRQFWIPRGHLTFDYHEVQRVCRLFNHQRLFQNSFDTWDLTFEISHLKWHLNVFSLCLSLSLAHAYSLSLLALEITTKVKESADLSITTKVTECADSLSIVVLKCQSLTTFVVRLLSSSTEPFK